MIYQRLAMKAFRSTANTEHQSHRHADHLIRQQEEYACKSGKHEHHGGGDRGLAPARPSDLGRLLAHFLQELERTDFCHCFNSTCVLILMVSIPDASFRIRIESKSPVNQI